MLTLVHAMLALARASRIDHADVLRRRCQPSGPLPLSTVTEFRGGARWAQRLSAWSRTGVAPLALHSEAFEPRRVAQGHANSLSLVRLDRDDYSVPTAYAHHDVTCSAGSRTSPSPAAPTWWPGTLVTGARKQTTFDPIHYLDLLERKPGCHRIRPTSRELGTARVLLHAAPARPQRTSPCAEISPTPRALWPMSHTTRSHGISHWIILLQGLSGVTRYVVFEAHPSDPC